MKRKIFLLFWFLAICALGFAQNSEVQQTIEDLIESTGEELSDETDIQEILEDLEYFRQNPLPVNQATFKEFIRLHLLSEPQINNLINFRNKTGTIYSIYELASIDGFTPDVLQKVEPFITFEMKENYSGHRKSSGDVFLRSTRSFSEANQAEQSKYEGTPERYYLRLKQTTAKFDYGLVAEKDPGEAFFSQSNKRGFDYTSAFVTTRIGNSGSRIFFGDYHVRFGQGLVAWQGFSMGKSAETTQNYRSNQGIRSYSSTDENQFFRGLAAQINFGHFTFFPFVSRHRVDASVDTLDGKPYFGAFQTSGYHRTDSEITGKNSVAQLAGGGHLNYSTGNWTFGFTTVYTQFDVEMNRKDDPYNQFLPEGKENLVGGFDWKGSVKKVFLYGEAAISAKSGRGLLMGAMVKPASNAELSLIYRNFNKSYFSYYSNAFSESSRINDEQALYIGMKLFPAPRWVVWAYADFFRFKWLKYLTAAPSEGTEFFAQVAFNPSRETGFYLRLFQEEKGQKLILENSKFNEQQLIDRIRLNYTQALNERFSLKSRFESSFYSKQSNEKGFLICQDVIYRTLEKQLSMNGRVAYFHTDGYNSRLYAYENDVLYAFSIPALYNEGIRTYFNLQKTFGNSFSLWLKLAATHQFARKDGSETIDPSTKTEIRVQIRYQF